jgi:RNA recognition motif-containing protein
MFHHYRCQTRPDLKNEVFIEGFPSDWTSDELKNYLQSRNVGGILSIRVIPPKFDGRCSFAFVTFERNVENVILELNHHPAYFGGRQMTVSRAKSRARLKDRRPTKEVKICEDPIVANIEEPKTVPAKISFVEEITKVHFILEKSEEALERVSCACERAVHDDSAILRTFPARNAVFAATILGKARRCSILQYLRKTARVVAIDFV